MEDPDPDPLDKIKLLKLSEAEEKARSEARERRKKELEKIEKRLKQDQMNTEFTTGFDTIISPSAIIDYSAKITIGNNCLISHRTVIHTHKHPLYMKREFDERAETVETLHPLVIEDNVAIFSDCLIMPSVEIIHKSCVILSGSVLTKSTTAPFQIWGRNPAKFIKLKDN